MIDDPSVDRLLEELLDSGSTPEEVCRSCPELLSQVRAGLLQGLQPPLLRLIKCGRSSESRADIFSEVMQVIIGLAM